MSHMVQEHITAAKIDEDEAGVFIGVQDLRAMRCMLSAIRNLIQAVAELDHELESRVPRDLE